VTTELIHHFEARGANLEALRSKAPRVLLAGPAGTGKTTVWLEKAHQLCLRTPKVKCLILRQTMVSLTASGVQTYEKSVAAEALLDGTVTFFGGSRREPPAYRYSNGSTISLGGLDDPMKVMSTDYDWIYIIEATEVSMDSIEMVTTRLRNGRLSFHQLALDCNPDAPTHPLKLECDAGRMIMLHSRHEDNPRFFNADGTMTPAGTEYMATLDALTGVRYLRLRKGIWAAAEGVIYEEFNPAIHVIDRFDPPADWRRLWAVDFGYVHPFVWQDWAIDPDGKMVLVREIFKTQTLVEDHARKIRSVCGWGPLDPITGRVLPYEGTAVTGWSAKRPYVILCDHDAEDRATLDRHLGIPTRPANKNVKDGLQTTAARYRLDGRGRPQIGFMRDAVVERDLLLEDAKQPASTVEEIPGYVWNDKGKDEPLKIRDDGCDALRYCVMELDTQGRPRVRFM
jgi:phage terminase large subunit